MRSAAAILLATGMLTAGSVRAADAGDAKSCSSMLAQGHAMPAADHRRCVIAIADAYLDSEQNGGAPDAALMADDVSRHLMGVPGAHAAGNRTKLAADKSNADIAKIANRQWTVEGNRAWVAFDFSRKPNPDQLSFHLAEQITLNKGLIKEIIVAVANGVQ